MVRCYISTLKFSPCFPIMFRVDLTPSARTGALPPGDWLDTPPSIWFGIGRRHSTNVGGLVVGHMIVRRGHFFVCPAAYMLVLRSSWLACEIRVAFRSSYQVALSRPLGLSKDECHWLFECGLWGSQLHQHQFTNKQ